MSKITTDYAISICQKNDGWQLNWSKNWMHLKVQKKSSFLSVRLKSWSKLKEMMIFYYYKHDNIQLLEKMADSESKQVLLIKKRME